MQLKRELENNKIENIKIDINIPRFSKGENNNQSKTHRKQGVYLLETVKSLRQTIRECEGNEKKIKWVEKKNSKKESEK